MAQTAAPWEQLMASPMNKSQVMLKVQVCWQSKTKFNTQQSTHTNKQSGTQKLKGETVQLSIADCNIANQFRQDNLQGKRHGKELVHHLENNI